MKTLFWYDLQKRSSCVFLRKLGTISLNQTTLGAIFSRIVGDFAYTCRDFDHIFKDFARIFDNWKLLWMRLHPWIPASYTSLL